MKNQIFHISELAKRTSLQDIRKLCPVDIDEFRDVVNGLNNILKLEEFDMDEVVRIEVGKGTYVKAIQFESSKELTFLFNEGSTKTIDQTKGTYSIGESKYTFNHNVLGTVDVNLDAFHNTFRLLSKCVTPADMANMEWIDILYRKLPGVRKNNEDALYNLLDVNQMCRRVEVFRSYVTQAVDKMIRTIPDDKFYAIATLTFTRESSYIIEDMIDSINTHRFYKISLIPVDGLMSSHDIYTYYLKDIWVHPSALDHNIVGDYLKRMNVDENLSTAASADLQYLTETSSLIVSAYYPILNSYFKDGSIGVYTSSKFDYSQHWYVPHKPYSLINLTLKGDENLIHMQDSTVESPDAVFKYRLITLCRMVVINFNRNSRLALPQQAKDMEPYSDSVLQKFKFIAFDGVPFADWPMLKIMRAPIRLSTKKLAYTTDVTFETSLDLIVKVAHLEEGILYTTNELQEYKMDGSYISRALEIGLLEPWKDGVTLKYKKYKRQTRSFAEYMGVPMSSKFKQISLVKTDGGVSVPDARRSDQEVFAMPRFSNVKIDGKDFSSESSYNPYDFLDMIKPVHSTDNYIFNTDSPIEFVESPSVDKVSGQNVKPPDIPVETLFRNGGYGTARDVEEDAIDIQRGLWTWKPSAFSREGFVTNYEHQGFGVIETYRFNEPPETIAPDLRINSSNCCVQ